MKKKAINALIEMGMPANTKGFSYIVDAMVLFQKEDYKKEKMLSLYCKIAQINNTTASKVERAIRYAFEAVLKKGYLNSVEKWLSLQNTTNSNLLHVLYLRLSQED